MGSRGKGVLRQTQLPSRQTQTQSSRGKGVLRQTQLSSRQTQTQSSRGKGVLRQRQMSPCWRAVVLLLDTVVLLLEGHDVKGYKRKPYFECGLGSRGKSVLTDTVVFP